MRSVREAQHPRHGLLRSEGDELDQFAILEHRENEVLLALMRHGVEPVADVDDAGQATEVMTMAHVRDRRPRHTELP